MDDGCTSLERKAELDAYSREVYSLGIDKYVEALCKHRLEGMKRVVDVGCGSGQWMIAVAKLNPEAEVYGIDKDKYLMEHAGKEALERGIANCLFINDTYENLPARFEAFSVDLILCNSVIQYVDTGRAMCVFARLLKPGGRLVMFNNHGSGYYLRRLLLDVAHCEIRRALYPLKVILHTLFPKSAFLGRNISDRFMTFHEIEAFASREKIAMERIMNEFNHNQPDTFLGFTCIFSCKGTKG
ncbi:MAG: hypothetical protein A2X45_19850 [Lentisphaerae bacterium GWF2_50_93]|nr:MAG: hypothetical protein A2X45_19850 [Lentisphaerae bacterium GWF2_50_93]